MNQHDFAAGSLMCTRLTACRGGTTLKRGCGAAVEVPVDERRY